MQNKFPDFYIPQSNILIKLYGQDTASLWGKIWLYEQGKDGYCSASYQTLSKELNISRSTIIRLIKKLLEDKLILDISPNKFNVEGTTRRYKTDPERLIELGTSVSLTLPSITVTLASVTLEPKYINSNINSSIYSSLISSNIEDINTYSNNILQFQPDTRVEENILLEPKTVIQKTFLEDFKLTQFPDIDSKEEFEKYEKYNWSGIDNMRSFYLETASETCQTLSLPF